MAIANTILKHLTPLQQLLEDINFQRSKEMRQLLKDESGFVVLQGTTYWTDLFVRHFLFQSDPLQIDSDDLLFFVRKKHVKTSSRHMPKYESELNVFRKDSRKLPVGDPDVDWEETVYLNMVIHQFDYILTLAICTRTSPKELQVLKRHSQRVYASPSRRKMDSKGDGEEITYPHICFMVDNFDEVFSDILVRDGEMVCVELVANDKDGSVQGVIFLGSIRYDALKKVYDARQSSISTKVAQRMSFGLFSSGSTIQTRCEFVRMKGPNGKGHAEMAVTKPRGSGVETPTSEPGFCATDMWDDFEIESDDYCNYRQQRRLSDPSANLNTFSKYSWRTKNSVDACGTCVGVKARSENEGLDSLASEITEIEAADLKDDLYPAFSVEAKLHISACCENMRTQKDVPKKQLENDFHSVRLQEKCCFGTKSAEFITTKDKELNTYKKPNHCVSPDTYTNLPEMSKIHRLETYESSYDTPACLNTMPEEKPIMHQEDACNEIGKFHISMLEQIKKKGCTNTCTRTYKNTSKIKDKDNLNEKSNIKKNAFTKLPSKSKTIDGLSKKVYIENMNKVGQRDMNKLKSYEIANDAISLKDYEINSSVTPEFISLLNDSDEGQLINVNGMEELPILQETSKRLFVKESKMITSKLFQLKKESEKLKITRGLSKDNAIEADKNISKVTMSDIAEAFISNSTKNESKVYTYGDSLFLKTKLYQQKNICNSNESSPKSCNYTLLPRKSNKSIHTVPKRRTPDGTNIYYWCDFPQSLVKEIDDGAFNPIWASRGFMQSFHFWKENRRQSSIPLNAFLTYITLPWWSIAKDLLDHREAPILTF